MRDALSNFDYADFYEGEEVDKDVQVALPLIEDIIAQQKVVTDREVKVRLEDKFFPWVTGRALDTMERDGVIRRVGYVGRRTVRGRVPEVFYAPYGMEYERIVGTIIQKRRVTRDINAILTAHAPAGTHAEDLFEETFEALGFKIHGRDVSEFKGRHVLGVQGKQPPNLDFVIERDRVVYGVDVKNWIKYEYNTRHAVISKVLLALQLKIVPFIIARYVDKDTIYRRVIEKGGICYPYRTLLVPPIFDSLATQAGSLMGYPILAVGTLPKYKVDWINTLHLKVVSEKG